MNSWKLGLALLLAAIGGPANGILLNFEDAPNGDMSTFYSPLGVTLGGIANPYQQSCGLFACALYTGAFPAPSTLPSITGGVYGWGFSVEGTTVAVGQGGTGTSTAFDGGILLSFSYDVSLVSLKGVDGGFNDREYVTLTAYDVSGNRIAQTFWNAPYMTAGGQVTPAAIAADGIRHVAFNYTNTAHGWFAIDDVEIMAALVPVPASAFLFLSGLLALGAVQKRQRPK